MTRHEAAEPPSTRDALLSGLLISLITAATLVRLRLASLDGPLAEIAGAVAGAIFVPVALAQLASLRFHPRPGLGSPLLWHAVVVPWAVALASAAAIVAGSSWALAAVRGAGLDTPCASFDELVAARWSASGSETLLATLGNGSQVQFLFEAERPTCRTVPPSHGGMRHVR